MRWENCCLTGNSQLNFETKGERDSNWGRRQMGVGDRKWNLSNDEREGHRIAAVSSYRLEVRTSTAATFTWNLVTRPHELRNSESFSASTTDYQPTRDFDISLIQFIDSFQYSATIGGTQETIAYCDKSSGLEAQSVTFSDIVIVTWQ